MTKETVRKLYKHYCECVETGKYEGVPLKPKSLDNMKKAKEDIEKNRPWILEESKENKSKDKKDVKK